MYEYAMCQECRLRVRECHSRLASLGLKGGDRFRRREDAQSLSWTRDASAGFVRLVFLATVGLILPALVGIAPAMVPVTVAWRVVLMVGAMITHGSPGQPRLVRGAGRLG